MSRLTRDGAAEPVSRDQILRREHGDRNKNIFLAQLTTSRIGNLTRFILTLAVYDGHTYSTYILALRVLYKGSAVLCRHLRLV